MQRKIQVSFYDPAWYFLMRWISWCCRFFNYGKGKYCNPRSNINILIPKMDGVWDRSRSLVTSHVRVMFDSCKGIPGNSYNSGGCLVVWRTSHTILAEIFLFSTSTFVTLLWFFHIWRPKYYSDSDVWRHRGNLTAWRGGQSLCNFVIFTLNIKYFLLP